LAAETKYGPIQNWDVTKVRDMTDIFYNESSFNGDISGWNVSNATNMRMIFAGATNFNKNISGWDVSQVTDMSYMFSGARAFTADISGWNVGAVTNMDEMFNGASVFNADISGWNVGNNVTNMSGMFNNGATNFNRNISVWDVRNVISYQDFGISGANIPIWGTWPLLNASLSGLVVSSVTGTSTLSPAFKDSTRSYTSSVASSVSSITVTPTKYYTLANIAVNGSLVTSGSPSGAIPLT
jgi:surface protein